MKRSHVLVYIGFYKAQDIEKLENSLRWLVKKKKFPPFHKLIIGVDHKGLKKQRPYQPIVLQEEELNIQPA